MSASPVRISAVWRMVCELIWWMSSSRTGHFLFRRTVLQHTGSSSTPTTILNPAASKPKSSPPTPVYRLIALSTSPPMFHLWKEPSS